MTRIKSLERFVLKMVDWVIILFFFVLFFRPVLQSLILFFNSLVTKETVHNKYRVRKKLEARECTSLWSAGSNDPDYIYCAEEKIPELKNIQKDTVTITFKIGLLGLKHDPKVE
jgi:hypothetical protein